MLNNVFFKGQQVICVNDEFALGGLKKGNTYFIDKQTFAGYIWVSGILFPFLPSRFVVK